MPILLDKQRSIAKVGALRMGERKQTNRPGFQRDTWRLTTANKSALIAAEKVYPGVISPFPSNPGEWELDTKSNQLSVIIDTTLSVDENYLQQDGKTTTHKCDGVNCLYLEIVRNKNDKKKIDSCVERGVVPCLCDPEYAAAYLDPDSGVLPEPIDDDKRACDLITSLRVILPASGDLTLWEFKSKGKIFNKEVMGMIESLRAMGIRQAYCHLTINRLEKHRGDKVSKFGVARLTLDPNPPNFAAALLANTPLAQAQALQASQAAALTGRTASSLPAPDKDRVKKAHALTTEQGQELAAKVSALGLKLGEFCSQAFDEGEIGFAALLRRAARLKDAQDKPDDKVETVEGVLVEDESAEPPDPFGDDQPSLMGDQDA